MSMEYTPHDLLLANAVRQDDVAMARAALAAGADACLFNNGESLLHVAARNGSAQMVSLLLAYGCKTSYLNGSHFTPLHEAVARQHYAVARMLLAAGANVNAQQNAGYSQSPLHLALWSDARDGVTDRCQFLLRHGADREQLSYLPAHGNGARGNAAAQARALGEKGERLAQLFESWAQRKRKYARLDQMPQRKFRL